MSLLYKSLIKKQTHVGYITDKNTLDSIFCISLGLRKNVVFFNLDFSFQFFNKFFNLLNSLYYKKYRFMFTIMDENFLQITKRLCKFINQTFIFGKWPNGLLTNFKKISIHASFLQTSVKRFRDKLSLFSDATGSSFFFFRTFLDGVDFLFRKKLLDLELDSKKHLHRSKYENYGSNDEKLFVIKNSLDNSSTCLTKNLLNDIDSPLQLRKQLILFIFKYYKYPKSFNLFYIRFERLLPSFFPKIFCNLDYSQDDIYKPIDNFVLKIPSFNFFSTNISLHGIPYPVPLSIKTIENIYFFFCLLLEYFLIDQLKTFLKFSKRFTIKYFKNFKIFFDMKKFSVLLKKKQLGFCSFD